MHIARAGPLFPNLPEISRRPLAPTTPPLGRHFVAHTPTTMGHDNDHGVEMTSAKPNAEEPKVQTAAAKQLEEQVALAKKVSERTPLPTSPRLHLSTGKWRGRRSAPISRRTRPSPGRCPSHALGTCIMHRLLARNAQHPHKAPKRASVTRSRGSFFGLRNARTPAFRTISRAPVCDKRGMATSSRVHSCAVTMMRQNECSWGVLQPRVASMVARLRGRSQGA